MASAVSAELCPCLFLAETSPPGMERSVQAQLLRLEVPEDGRQTGEETALFLVVSLARRQTRRDSGDHVLRFSGPGVPSVAIPRIRRHR